VPQPARVIDPTNSALVRAEHPGAIEDGTQVATQKRIEGKALSMLDRARAVTPPAERSAFC